MKHRQSLATLVPKLVLALGITCVAGVAPAYALPEPTPQQATQAAKEIKGTVIDHEGEPVIGASVIIKGTKAAAATDIDGNYVLRTTEANPVLQFSYVGCKTIEVAAKGKSVIDVTLEPSSESLEEVVVTALGIKRQTKALGYSVQDIKGDMLTEARENNILNSLGGRIAGLQVSGSGSGSAGSSRIIIRGNNSLAGNNEPLVVVDGVPINNSNGGSGGKQWGGTDTGNGLNDINPDDIESISVLKGPAAAALYGARAGNGVLMITTKKGSETKGLGVSFNSNVMIERPLAKAKMQNVYGQGTNGQYVGGNNLSWGPKMEGQMIEDWTGEERPFLAYDNDIMDYLKTGVTTTNTVETGYTGDRGSVRATLSYQYMDGVVPKNHNDKLNINLRATVNMAKNVQLDAKMNYIKSTQRNSPTLGDAADGIMRNYLIMPRSIHYSDLADAYDENGVARRWWDDQSFALNPYVIEDNESNRNRSRFIGFFSLNWDITDWLSVKVRHGEDFYWTQTDAKTKAAYPYGDYVGSGRYQISNRFDRECNTDALITAQKDNLFGSKFSGLVSVGGNLRYGTMNSSSIDTGSLNIADFFYIPNGKAIIATEGVSKKAVNSIYAFAQLNYGNWAFLDVTARNDWSSTLPRENRSFFYPSVGVGWVVTDMLRQELKVNVPQWFTFGKVRASYAQVGNDTGAYQINSAYDLAEIIIGNPIKGSYVSEVHKLATLKPELIVSTEAGFDARFFDNRLGIDFTWYKKNATNQILSLPVTKSSGYSSRYINAGNIENHGIEVVLTATPVRTPDFQWNTTINYTHNRNIIKELHKDLDVYILGKYQFAQVVALEGGTYGDIVGYRYQRNPEGRIIVDGNGLPLREENFDTSNPIGNYLPKWSGSWSNNFSWRNFSLGFLLDLRVGGDIYMNSLAQAAVQGTNEMSLEGRDEWYAGTGGILVDGVQAVTGADGSVSYVENTTYANPQEYWSRVKDMGERHVYDGTNLRLRELTFGYTVPKKALAKTPFTSFKLSFVARNLWIIYNNVPGGYDPETIISTGNAGGIEHFSFPTMRSFGFNLNVSF